MNNFDHLKQRVTVALRDAANIHNEQKKALHPVPEMRVRNAVTYLYALIAHRFFNMAALSRELQQYKKSGVSAMTQTAFFSLLQTQVEELCLQYSASAQTKPLDMLASSVLMLRRAGSLFMDGVGVDKDRQDGEFCAVFNAIVRIFLFFKQVLACTLTFATLATVLLMSRMHIVPGYFSSLSMRFADVWDYESSIKKSIDNRVTEMQTYRQPSNDGSVGVGIVQQLGCAFSLFVLQLLDVCTRDLFAPLFLSVISSLELTTGMLLKLVPVNLIASVNTLLSGYVDEDNRREDELLSAGVRLAEAYRLPLRGSFAHILNDLLLAFLNMPFSLLSLHSLGKGLYSTMSLNIIDLGFFVVSTYSLIDIAVRNLNRSCIKSFGKTVLAQLRALQSAAENQGAAAVDLKETSYVERFNLSRFNLLRGVRHSSGSRSVSTAGAHAR